MANQLSIVAFGARAEEREKRVRYSVTLSGSYVQHVRGQAIGEVLNLNGALNPGFLADCMWSIQGPDTVYLLNTGGTGYAMSIVPGADARHPLLCIFGGIATELAAGTYLANANGLLTDLDIIIEAAGRNL